MKLNPFCLKVKGNEQENKAPFEFYIGEPKKITNCMYRKDVNQLLIEVDGKWYEVEDPDMKVFLSVCKQFNVKKESIVKKINKWLRK